ncbi:mitogen-activated protein kinase kinase kinase 3 [Corylus avellana]|uniref:mitogen-activated protein kinase kinase kinase 3 n=1 Tax=Corylus avellana TaxID=13451 RepID=UPI001E20EBF6|nr:mitogen-activated protein kinase kinase kinase 3 [Corylus avellana]
MPAWWGKKSGKSKEQNPLSAHLYASKSSVNNERVKAKDKEKASSFDEVFCRNSPRTSKDFGGSSGFSGFDSDGGDKVGHPLPRPSILSGNDHIHGAVVGMGSGSVSSVSSSGSSEDQPVAQEQAQFSQFRGIGDTKTNTRSRSPGPSPRGPSSPTSPLHLRLCGLNLESPTGKQEDGKSQCHRLPLPPGSPTSPSALPNTRTSGVVENTTSTQSNWKKGRLLGRGTFGHVYLGFNSGSGQMCAIKEVRVASDDQTSRECLKQLNQEINLLSQLSHPNIVRYYGSELGEETLSVYLEYVSGGSIHKLLQEYGPFKEPVIQNYTRQIISGLAYLHGRHTVHRDIKGANILVDPNGEIKLADFGMAKHITACSSMLSFKGSPYWMAPEVVMNTNGYSLAVDIWSLGCTILEMATSKPPWSQYEGVAAIFKIGNSKDTPEIPECLSNDAKSFIKLCLQRDPLARPTAIKLLDHPFIRDQATTRVANINVTKDAFPYMFDGSRTPPVLELHSNRSKMTLSDRNYATMPVFTSSGTSKSPRDSIRAITSLPVSPCSSPLRHYGPAHKSGFLSPPHPTYAMMGQSGYNSTDYNSYTTMRASPPSYTFDPWRETSPYRAHTPGSSPRTRPI